MGFWLLQGLNGISFGMLLFLLAAGLSLIFGLMRIINLAHGSFYLLGAYIGLTVMQRTHSFVLAMLASVLVLTVLGAVILRLFLFRFVEEHLAQVLLTYGFLFILGDLTLWVWGGNPQTVPIPSLLSGSLLLGSVMFPTYRLFVIIVGTVVAILLGLVLERTRIGAIVRAGVDDAEMVQAAGVNIRLVFMVVFGLGALLAALGGVIGGPIVGASPGTDFEVLMLAFVVVIVGGLGSLRGAFVGSMMVGLVDNFGKSLFPQFALFTIFVPMVIVLAVRPHGLFGRT